MEGYRNEKAAVAEALRRGERPDLATTEESYFERGECLMGNLPFTEFCLIR